MNESLDEKFQRVFKIDEMEDDGDKGNHKKFKSDGS